MSEQIDTLTDAFNYINQDEVETIIVLKKSKDGYCHAKVFGNERFIEIVGMMQLALFDYQQSFHSENHLEEFHDVRFD